MKAVERLVTGVAQLSRSEADAGHRRSDTGAAQAVLAIPILLAGSTVRAGELTGAVPAGEVGLAVGAPLADRAHRAQPAAGDWRAEDGARRNASEARHARMFLELEAGAASIPLEALATLALIAERRSAITDPGPILAGAGRDERDALPGAP